MARLELVGVDIDFEAKILELDNDVLTSSHRVIILVPASNLVLIDSQKPGDKTDEVDELL